MKYTSVSVHQLKNRKNKPWQARAEYKDVNDKWRETSKVFSEATGKKEAQRLADEWLADNTLTKREINSYNKIG